MHKIISHKEAKEQGLKKYFINKTCPKGHNTFRYVHNATCVTCIKTFSTENKEQIKVVKSLWYRTNKKRLNTKTKNYYEENKEHINKQSKKYRNNNPNIVRLAQANRRAKKQKAYVKWANKKAINEFYKNCPKDMHVDHIIPLNSRLVCGLHVESNLQYLNIKLNQNKSNKFVPFIERMVKQGKEIKIYEYK